jgi:hypothetical protein
VNFNVNFNVLLSKYIVHPLVKIKRTLIKSVFSNKQSECALAKPVRTSHIKKDVPGT